MYYLIRQALFFLGPEVAHEVVLKLLQFYGSLARGRNTSETIQVAGVSFNNRLGLAAGFDKNAVAAKGLAALGFGFLEIGTVTPLKQEGNPRPRLFRLEHDQALVNRMGFNNDGVDTVVRRLSLCREKVGVPIGINVGKNKSTTNELAVEDYRICLDRAYPLADYLTINISSPNTPDLRKLQGIHESEKFLVALNMHRDTLTERCGRRVPMFVKLAPDLSGKELKNLVTVSQASGIDGIVATNTTVSRNNLVSRWQSETGGLSGVPLFEKTLETVSAIRDLVGRGYPIIGVGGISTPQDAREMLAAGADLLQIYTSFIYQGPAIIDLIKKELSQ